MKFKDKSSEDVSIDLTPFIDVVFMLLLFFVVSTAFIKSDEHTQLSVDLPTAQTDKVGQQKMLMVNVDEKGHYTLKSQKIGPKIENLKLALTQTLKNEGNQPLMIAGDKKAPHQAIVSVLQTAQELQIENVQILAQEKA